MDRERLAVGLGALGTLVVVGLTALPYLLFAYPSVSVYYRVGILGPPWIALFAAVATLTLLAGARDRTDPPQAAGIAVTVALFALVLAVSWAIPAGPVAAGFDVDAIFASHPPGIAVGTLLLLLGSTVYAADVLGVLGR